MMGPVENIPGKEAKMAKKANVIGFFFFDLRQMLTCRFAAGKNIILDVAEIMELCLTFVLMKH